MPPSPLVPTEEQLADRVAATTPATEPTIGSAYGVIPLGDQEIDTQTGIYKQAASTPIDEAAIRQNALDRFEAEIAATKGVYTEKLRQATVAGNNRLGQTAAINARRGLAGSDFGASNTDHVNTDNASVYGAIGDQQAAAIAAINAKGIALGDSELKQRLDAKQQGAENYIKFLTESDNRRTNRTQQAAKAAAAAGIDLSTATPDMIKAIAQSYQISPDALVSAYVDAKSAAAKAQLDQEQTQSVIAKNKADAAAPNYGSGMIGEYNYAKEQGYTGSLIQYQNEDANRKAKATGGVGGGLSSSQMSAFNSIVNRFQTSPLIAASNRTPVLEASIKGIRNDPSNAAQQLNLAYSYVQALDTYQSAVREGELGLVNSIDSKIGQLQNSLSKMQNGQIVRPEVALQIADAAQNIVDTIKAAAARQATSYKSQADTVGLGTQWDQYTSGFQSSYETTPAAAPTPTPKGTMKDTDFVNAALTSHGVKYQDAVAKIPAGKKGVIDNATGQMGAIDPSEFDPSLYTAL